MKKLLLRIIFSFTLGLSVLMISYIGIYYIAGEEVFDSVIIQLTNVSVLEKQFLIAGIAGSLLSIAIYVLEEVLKKEKPSLQRILVSVILFLTIIILSMLLITNTSTFDKAVESMLIIISCILAIGYGLFYCIKSTIDDLIINKKIKEKNNI